MNKKLLSGLMAGMILFSQGASLSAQKPNEGVVSKFLKNNKKLVSKGIGLLALAGGVAYIYRNNDNSKNDSPKNDISENDISENDIPKADGIKHFDVKNDDSKKEPAPAINLGKISYPHIEKINHEVKIKYSPNVNSIDNLNESLAGFLNEGRKVRITSFKGKILDAMRCIINISSKIDKRASVLADDNARKMAFSNTQNYDIVLNLETSNKNGLVLRYSFEVSEQKPVSCSRNISARHGKSSSRDLSSKNKSVNLSKDYKIEIGHDAKWKYIFVYNNSYKHESLSQMSKEERSRLINEIHDIVKKSDKKGISVIINGYVKRDSDSGNVSENSTSQASEFLDDFCEKIGMKESEDGLDLKAYDKEKGDVFEIKFVLDKYKKIDRVGAFLGHEVKLLEQ